MNNYIIYEEMGKGKHSIVHKVGSLGEEKKIDRVFHFKEL